MKKLIQVTTILLALFLGLTQTMQAQCTTAAGSMDDTPLLACVGESLTATFNNDATLDPDDVVQFILHDSPGTILGTIYETRNDLDFTFQSGMIPNVIYYVSAVAGNNDGSGNVELSDECLSISPGQPVKFSQPVFESCGGSTLTCNNPQFFMDCYITGAGPFELTWQLNAVFLSNDSTILVTQPGVYELTAVDQNGCQQTHAITIEENTNPPALEIIAEGELGCGNGSVTLTADVGEDISNYQVLWATAENAPSITVNTPGIYCVTVVDNSSGCSAEDCYEVLLDNPGIEIDLPETYNIACPNEGVYLFGTPLTGTELYTFVWEDDFSNTLETTQGVQVYAPGVYHFFVTDSEGCTGMATTIVTSDLIANAGPDQFLDCNGPVTLGLGEPPTTTGDEVIYQWSGPSSFNSNLLNPIVSEPGTYTLRVTTVGSPDCYAEDVVEVLEYELPPAEISEIYYGCDTVTLVNEGIEVGFPVIYEWVLPDGSTANGNFNLYLMENQGDGGIYQLRVIDEATGCTAISSVVIDFDNMTCANIRGYVFRDEGNCLYDGDELGLTNFVLRFNNGTDVYYRIVQSNGFYDAELPLGTYEVSVVLPNSLWLPCQLSYNVVIDSEGEVVEQDLPLQHEEGCPELEVFINNVTPVRLCQEVVYKVSYNNYNGTDLAEEATITVTLDPLMTFVSSNYPVSQQNGNELTFIVSNIIEGYGGNFNITVALGCEGVLGQTHCVEAIIFPNEPCEEINELWSGASLRVEGECNEANEEVVFTISNDGTGNMDTSSKFIVIEDGVMFIPNPDTVKLDVGEEYEAIFPANGHTYRVEVMQVPYHPGFSMPNATVEGCGTDANGNFSTGFVTAFPPDDEDDFIDIDCDENVFSYDPNDKLAYPKGYGDEHYIYANTDIEYTIRFQNTGTDTAFRVQLRDTLSSFLEPSSIRVAGASHDYTYNLEAGNVLLFNFDNILLPDSTTNLDASQGFVTFRIDQKPDLPLETVIENRAGIYFDFNEVVMTNTVFHRIGENTLEVIDQVVEPDAPFREMVLSPNPTRGAVRLQLDGIRSQGYQLKLFDAMGRPVHKATFVGNQYDFQVHQLPEGLYWLSIEHQGYRVAAAKLMIAR